MSNKNTQQIGILAFVFVINLLSFTGVLAQSGGAAKPQGRISDNKADQNLKSLAHINPSTLAMEMNIPFMTYPGRSGNSLPVGLSYSSKLWRMRNSGTYFYLTPTGLHKQYVTHLTPTFGERSVAGWTSSIGFPAIEEKLETFDQDGNPFTQDVYIDSFHARFLEAMNSNPGSNSLHNPELPCGMACVERTRWCWDGNCTPWQCSGWEFNTANCTGDWGGGDDSCYYAANGACPPSCSSCIEPPTDCPPFNPQCDIDPDIPETPEPPRKMHYVKRVHVRMGDGATHEFRKSDEIFGHCSGGIYDGPNCESIDPDNYGMFLSVDGSGMKLERTTEGSTLYLPDGGRFVFPNSASGSFDGSALYQSTDFYDADGNHSTFEPTAAENQFASNNQRVRKMTDTMGREIFDPLPDNLSTQNQQEGDQTVSLPGLTEEATQDYVLKWRHLKPVPCGGEVTTNCGNTEGALENQNENLFFYASHICAGSDESSVDPLGQFPNQKLFPLNGYGLRSCNPGTTTANAERFNVVVLSGVALPNGKSYTFKYNQFGEITKIVYPTGSYETFTYSQIPSMNGNGEPAYEQTNRGVTERRVYSVNGVLEQRWQYSAALQTIPGNESTYTITTKAPRGDNPLAENGAKSERSLRTGGAGEFDFGFNAAGAGMPTDERNYDEAGNLRSRTITRYVTKTNGIAQRDARAEQSISIIIENGLALASFSKTIFDENGSTDPEFFSHLNVKRTEGHNFAVISLNTAQNGSFDTIAGYFNQNTLAAVSENDYMYGRVNPQDALQQGDLLKQKGIVGVKTESRVLNPQTGATIAKSQTKYDEFPSVPSDSLPVALASTWVDPGSVRGKPSMTRAWDSVNNVWHDSKIEYDQYGNVRRVWEPTAETETDPPRFVETQYLAQYGFAYPTKVITPAPDPTNTHGTNQGAETTSTYDFNTGLPVTSTNEFGQTILTEYVDPLLRPTRVSGVGGFVIPTAETIYDDNALTVTTRKQIGANNWEESTAFSDSLGRTFKTVSKDSQGDIATQTRYDFLGRVTRTTNPYRLDGSNQTEKFWSRPRYDAAGRSFESCAPVAATSPDDGSVPSSEAYASPACATGPEGASLGTTSYGISTASGYIGTFVLTTDAAGKQNRAISNTLGQVIRVDEPDHTGAIQPLTTSTPTPSPSPSPSGTPPPPPTGCAAQCLTNVTYGSNATLYRYNELGNMVEVIQGEQHRYFKYDSLGRMIRLKQPEQEANPALDLADTYNTSGQWSAKFTYDLKGNVLSATDANNTVITNTYDRSYRVIKKSYSGGNSNGTPEVTYVYDGFLAPNQPPTQSPNFARGKLTAVSSSDSVTKYTNFDYLGRLTQMEQRTPFTGETPASTTPRISSYEYNFAGALMKETYPSGRIVQNEFEADGDLSRIYGKATPSGPERTYASGFSYTPDGKIQRLRLGNGRWESAKFNERMQVTEFALGASNGDGSLWKVNYAYGELNTDGSVNTAKNTGNIAKQTISFSGLPTPLVQTYRYDSLYRLTEARETKESNPIAPPTGPQTWKESFTYDRFGNRTGLEKFTGSTLVPNNNERHPTIDPLTNRFNTGQGYTFDKNGNLIEDADGMLFVFNGNNKQRLVTKNGSNLGEYYYDGEGKRVRKVEWEGTVIKSETIFVYSAGKLVEEYSTEPVTPNPTTKWTATDHLGSPRVVTDSNGAVVSRRDFMPFGEELAGNIGNRLGDNAASNSNFTYGANDNIRQKFTGYQKDTETGLDFAQARMYENRHGRFTAVDPLLASGKSANPQTFNRYAYCLNNPIIFNDPSGLQTGRWIAAPGSDGITRASYLPNGQSLPKGGEYITTRNKAGQLIVNSPDLPDGYVYKLNEYGPQSTPFDLDDWLLQSDYFNKGYQRIMSDEFSESCIEKPCDAYARGNQDVTFDLLITIIPAFQGGKAIMTGKAAMESGGSLIDDAAGGLADDAFVIRNGIPSAKSFENGSGVIMDEAGKLSGVSVKSATGKTVEELAEGGAERAVTKNGQIGVTTVREIVKEGGRITPDFPTNPNNPFHCEICGLSGGQLEMLFKQMPNPVKK